MHEPWYKRRGTYERIRVNEFYKGLTYWDALIKALAG